MSFLESAKRKISESDEEIKGKKSLINSLWNQIYDIEVEIEQIEKEIEEIKKLDKELREYVKQHTN